MPLAPQVINARLEGGAPELWEQVVDFDTKRVLRPGHYVVDRKQQRVSLTTEGMHVVLRRLGTFAPLPDLAAAETRDAECHLCQAWMNTTSLACPLSKECILRRTSTELTFSISTAGCLHAPLSWAQAIQVEPSGLLIPLGKAAPAWARPADFVIFAILASPLMLSMICAARSAHGRALPDRGA